MTDLAGQIRDDAVRSLSDALQWWLAPARWELVAEVLDLVAEAEESADPGELLDAIAQLEMVGPGRITRIGSTPTSPAPQPVRERINVLVHRLGGATVPTRPGPAGS